MLKPESWNKAQRSAVTRGEGPLLLLAGPGSGKTFTILQRVFFLLEQGVSPGRILVITFTREAQISLKRRFQRECSQNLPVNIGTFHSVFYYLLRESGAVSPNITFFQEQEKKKLLHQIIKKNMQKAGGQEADFPSGNTDIFLVLSAFGYYKNTLNWEEAAKRAPEKYREALPSLFRQFQEAAEKLGKMDYDDILYLCKEVLEKNENIRRVWQSRFSHILIDEFQDVNPVQYEVLKLLAAPPFSIMAVGDDDQSIYGFRGSEPECLKRFEQEFQAEILLLNQNYRSLKNIVEASGLVIREGKNRFEKKLFTGRKEKDEGEVLLKSFSDRAEEWSYLIKCLEELQEMAQREDIGETAVLFRTNASMNRFAAILKNRGIAFEKKGQESRLYEHFIVQDILAYLRLAEGERSEECLLRILNKPCRGLDRELTGEMKNSPAMLKLQKNLEIMRNFPPKLAVIYICKAIGYEEWLYQEAKGKETGNREGIWEEWQEILDWLKWDAAGYRNTAEWVQNLQESPLKEEKKPYLETETEENSLKKGEAIGKREKRRENPGAGIKLMTVHGAKGLEFERVFLPDCNEGNYPHGRMPEEKEVEEERRLFYVAMTRAKKSLELLYLTGTEKSPRQPSRFLNPLLNYSSSSSTSSSNSQVSRYSSKASATRSYSASSSI